MVPHRALGKITPQEVFSGKNSKVSRFRIFFSVAYFHVLDEKHTKLGQTVEKGLFVGYSET